MGMADREYIEWQERGWDDCAKHVCADCVDNVYLASLVDASAQHTGCDYCDKTDVLTAEVSCILEAVKNGIHYGFGDEAHVGAPYSKDFPIEYFETQDVLEETLSEEDVNWDQDLIDAVSCALHNQCWVAAPQGNFFGSYTQKQYQWSWAGFVSTVKHKSRFHLYAYKSVDDSGCNYGEGYISPEKMLGFLGHVFAHNQMVKKISTDEVLYRVRKGSWPLVADEAGPPPYNKATAGRMNPAGIPYLYLAFDERTALAEARARVAEFVTVSRWQPSRELQVLDLTYQPQYISIFEGRDQARSEVVFLRDFVNDVCKPVTDDTSDVEYVPTQLVCEYLAQVFFHAGQPLDGLIYPSEKTNGKNIVLFPACGQPDLNSALKKFGTVTFQSSEVIKV